MKNAGKVYLCLMLCALFASPALAAMSDVDFIELSRSGTLQQIQEAIRNGANVNAVTFHGDSPLFAAATSNPNPEVIMTLLTKTGAGADVNAAVCDWSGNSLISWVVQNPNLEVITFFIEASADVNARTEGGMSPLLISMSNPNPEVIMALIRAGAEVNVRYASGETPLLAATRNRYPKVILALLNAGADVSVRDDIGRTTLKRALMWAPWRNCEETIAALLEAGADVNARNVEGMTALMMAAARITNPDILMLLLKAGADPKAKDVGGNMAIDFARGNEAIRNTDAFWMLNDASF